MNTSFGAVFGALIAIILLLIFVFATWYMVLTVVYQCGGEPTCVPLPQDFFGDGFIYVVTTVGGLVSALVIAQLSVTEPGATPKLGTFEPTSAKAKQANNILVGLYLLAWVFTGLGALVVGVMLYPSGHTTVSDIGTTWLGLAVSAAYAYFGIRPAASRAGASSRETLEAATVAVDELKAQIAARKITFDSSKEDQLKNELLGSNSGTKVTAKLAEPGS
jgi:hypothetical protein